MKILFATSEAHPLVKTGGLADVSGSLPVALAQLGHDVRLVLPAYQSVLEKYPEHEVLSHFAVGGAGRMLGVRVLAVWVPELERKVWLLDIPELFRRPGNPYLAADGKDWWDNGERFGTFSRAVAELAMNRAGLDWRADVVHANDWQTGLVPAFLREEYQPPRTLFTIHNMAYAGFFPRSLFDSLWLPWHWWSIEGVEFYGQLSMLKAGIQYADAVTTVSPGYAREICTEAFAYGFAGIMRETRRQGRLHGILNGIDTRYWNPATDPYLFANYTLDDGLAAGKRSNRQALLQQLGAPAATVAADLPLLGFIGRLVTQKGVDLILEVLPSLLQQGRVNLVCVGSGDAGFEQALRGLAARFPEHAFVHIGYSEELAHQVEAGADIFLMPSRFEPCGLNQLYSLAYGTLPLVHHTGGLADTVVNASDENLAGKTATGFVFYDQSAHAMRSALEHALYVYSRPGLWQQMQRTAMEQSFSWAQSARAYADLYTKEH